MRFSAVLAIAAAVSSASAAQIQSRQQGYPSCANPCLASADFGSCDPLNSACLCNSQAFVSSTTACITKSCSGDELQQAEAAAQQVCLAVGVTLSSSAPASTQTAPASTSSSASTSAASATQSPNGVASRGANAIAALAAVGAVALAL